MQKLWIVRIRVQFFPTSYLYGHFDSLSSLLDDHSSHKPCVGFKNPIAEGAWHTKNMFHISTLSFYTYLISISTLLLFLLHITNHTSWVLINFIIFFFLWLTKMQLSTSKLWQTQTLLAKTSFKFVYYFITSSLAIYLDGLIQD